MNTRATGYLLEHHIVPAVIEELQELNLFFEETEAWLRSRHDEQLAAFVSEHHGRGVSRLPDGTSLEEFFEQNYYSFPEGRLTRHLRSSFVVSLYTLIESNLLDFCRCLRRKDALITVSDLRASNELDRAKVYIHKVLGVESPSKSPQWAEIQLCRRVRNCVVHAAGEVGPDSQHRRTIEDYANRHPELLQLQGSVASLFRGLFITSTTLNPWRTLLANSILGAN